MSIREGTDQKELGTSEDTFVHMIHCRNHMTPKQLGKILEMC